VDLVITMIVTLLVSLQRISGSRVCLRHYNNYILQSVPLFTIKLLGISVVVQLVLLGTLDIQSRCLCVLIS